MSNMDYVQMIPRIRAIENKLLDKSKIERLIDSKSKIEAFKILQETAYGTLGINAKKPEDYEIILSEELKRLYSFMYEITPNKKLIDFMSVRYDYHNIKVLLKAKILNKNLDALLIPVGTIEINNLKKYISTRDYRKLENIMRIGIEKAIQEFEEDKDPQKIDIVLDNYMYKDMMYRAKQLNEAYLINFLQKNIDLINIKTVIRGKKQKKSRLFLEKVLLEDGKIELEDFLESLNGNIENIINKFQYTDYSEVIKNGIEDYIESKNLNILEKLSDNFIINFIKDAKYVSFGIEPVIAYIMAKENEIKIVRIIMVGKLNSINNDVIRERLREIYV